MTDRKSATKTRDREERKRHLAEADVVYFAFVEKFGPLPVVLPLGDYKHRLKNYVLEKMAGPADPPADLQLEREEVERQHHRDMETAFRYGAKAGDLVEGGLFGGRKSKTTVGLSGAGDLVKPPRLIDRLVGDLLEHQIRLSKLFNRITLLAGRLPVVAADNPAYLKAIETPFPAEDGYMTQIETALKDCGAMMNDCDRMMEAIESVI